MTEDAISRQLEALRRDETVNLSKGTRRVYGTLWKAFADWCEANGHQSLPATDLAVVGYLIARYNGGLALTTLKTIRNAIASKHGMAGLPKPTSSEKVKVCLKLLRRQAAKVGRVAQKQAPAIWRKHIEQLEASRPTEDEQNELHPLMQKPWTAKDDARLDMDVAVLRVMHAAGLRSIEAANLRWADFTKLDSGQGRIVIRSSKTSDEPMYRLITRKAVKAIEKIKPEGAAPEDRVFRVSTGRALHNRIGRCMTGIVDGATGHSPRVGLAQELTAEGGSLQTVKEAGGWRSLAMPAHYARKIAPELGGVNLLED